MILHPWNSFIFSSIYNPGAAGFIERGQGCEDSVGGPAD